MRPRSALPLLSVPSGSGCAGAPVRAARPRTRSTSQRAARKTSNARARHLLVVAVLARMLGQGGGAQVGEVVRVVGLAPRELLAGAAHVLDRDGAR